MGKVFIAFGIGVDVLNETHPVLIQLPKVLHQHGAAPKEMELRQFLIVAIQRLIAFALIFTMFSIDFIGFSALISSDFSVCMTF